MVITFKSTDIWSFTVNENEIPDTVDKSDPEAIFRWYDCHVDSNIFENAVGIDTYAFDFEFVQTGDKE